MFGKYNGFVSKARVSACMYFLVGSLSFTFTGMANSIVEFCWQNVCLTSSLQLLVLISKESSYITVLK
jgi:hypothetical protein